MSLLACAKQFGHIIRHASLTPALPPPAAPPPSPPNPSVREGMSLTLLMKTEQTEHQKITERH